MVNIFITIDTEIWCDGWIDIDSKFPTAFKTYIYGPTPNGEYGLPIQLNILKDYGIKGIFFVEPLFSLRFGSQPLAEIVGLIQSNDQEVQLHIHPEWIDEAKEPIFNEYLNKSPFLRSFSLQKQKELIKLGKKLLMNTGVENISSFRAGSYAANNNTLKALAENDIFIDTSYNFASDAGVADIAPGLNLIQPAVFEDVTIYPVTFFKDRSPNKYRPLQLTACSTAEIEFILNYAFEQQWDSVVLVSHSFELLTPDKTKPNQLIVDRFVNLCKFLNSNRDRFQTCGMLDLQPNINKTHPKIPVSNPLRTLSRMLEQRTYTYR